MRNYKLAVCAVLAAGCLALTGCNRDKTVPEKPAPRPAPVPERGVPAPPTPEKGMFTPTPVPVPKPN